MKALITGATGFIGSRVARRLCDDGWQVHALVRAESRPLSDDLTSRVVAHAHDGTT
ncbi:MAG: GDP-mannose 4,6-dehydratase, partial [Planctomycetes bacterium]|nr:GDP-mannose 4,6-dehydratase [Planctomycetota bacterium]